jgi:DNA repair photolyase
VFKPDVAALLERELSKPGYQPRTLALGSNTDPYQPVERRLRLTRSVLEVLDRFNHPVTIVTKSAGVLGDLDILRRLADRGLVRVCLSLTTLDGALARRMEPRASSPALRLRALAALTAAGVPTGVLAAPMIPGLNDMELESLLEAAHQAGARSAGYVLLRLPLELRDMFTAWLEQHVPDRAKRVLALIRQTRAGRLNDSRFHDRFRGSGAYADLLQKRFDRVIRKLGMEERTPLDVTQFRPPAAAVERQLSLF